MQKILINGVYYYDSTLLLATYKHLLRDVKRPRDIVTKKSLTDSYYIYAYIKDNNWIISKYTYNKAKLLINSHWVDHNLITDVVNVSSNVSSNVISNHNLLPLEQHEKFKDLHGNVIDIEIIGSRGYDKCYFKLGDIVAVFELPNLEKNIHHYERGIIYETFYVNSCKSVYLTYYGLIKILMNSRSKLANVFNEWVVKTLFTIQYGSQSEKAELAANIIGVSSQYIKEALNTNSSNVPCVYFILIGDINDYIDGYPSETLLCKYGRSNDFTRRLRQHEILFKNDFNCNINVICFAIIEDKFLPDAEVSIKEYFSGKFVQYKNYKELVAINKEDIQLIKKHFTLLQNSYIGQYKELDDTIKDLKHQIVLKDKDMEIMKTSHLLDIKDKNIEIEQYKNKLKDKEIEVLQLRLQSYISK
jgi:hypothetical protein